ncbi:MAG: hypothetical protein AAF907_05995, partial [Planctomycetota bacterium]
AEGDGGLRAAPIGVRGDAKEVAARKAIRTRREALGLPADLRDEPDRTATVQLLGIDGTAPAFYAAVRDALSAAFPSGTEPILVRTEPPEMPPCLYLDGVADVAAIADAVPFLAPAEPVAGETPEDFDVSRTTAVRFDPAALTEQWMKDADAAGSAAVVAFSLENPPAKEEPKAAFGSALPGGGDGGEFRDNAGPRSPEAIAEAVRRELFALGPDGDAKTADSRTTGWRVKAIPTPVAVPQPLVAADEAPREGRRRRGEASSREEDTEPLEPDGGVGFLLIAGPLENPQGWLAAASRTLADGSAAATVKSVENAPPTLLVASAEPDRASRTLPAPADGDSEGWAYDLAVGGATDSGPNPGEATRDWALRMLANGSPAARELAARYFAATAPDPNEPTPEGAEEVRLALLAALDDGAPDAADSDRGNPFVDRGGAGGRGTFNDGTPFEDDNQFDNEPSLGVGSGEDAPSDAGFSSSPAPSSSGGPPTLVALLRWTFTEEQYVEAGEAAAKNGSLRPAVLRAILARTAEHPPGGEALVPFSDKPGAARSIFAALEEPGEPAEAAGMALLGSRDEDVRAAATELLEKVGGPDAAARLAKAAAREPNRTLARKMRKARIPILQRANR